MTVRVQLFAIAKDLAQTGVVELSLPDGATVADLRRALASEVPALAGVLGHMLFAINAEYATDATIVPAGAEIACIPPVSGG
jgi:sulfur-carrier protein